MLISSGKARQRHIAHERVLVLIEALVRDAHGNGVLGRHAVGHQVQSGDHAAHIDGVRRYLAVHSLGVQIEEQPRAALDILVRRPRYVCAQQLAELRLLERRHTDDRKARDKRFVQLARTGVTVVHRGDEARGGVDRDTLIARHVDEAAVVERGVQHGHSVVFRHVDLIQDAEASVLRGERDRAAAQPHLAAGEGVGSDQRAAVGIHMERHSVDRTAEQPRKVVRQDIFARGLAAGEQNVLPLQKRGDGQLHDLIADEFDGRLGDAAAHRLVRDVLLFELLQTER